MRKGRMTAWFNSGPPGQWLNFVQEAGMGFSSPMRSGIHHQFCCQGDFVPISPLEHQTNLIQGYGPAMSGVRKLLAIRAFAVSLKVHPKRSVSRKASAQRPPKPSSGLPSSPKKSKSSNNDNNKQTGGKHKATTKSHAHTHTHTHTAPCAPCFTSAEVVHCHPLAPCPWESLRRALGLRR